MELDKRLQEYYEFGKRVDNMGTQVKEHIQARAFVKSELLEKMDHDFRVQMAGFKK